MASSLQKLIRKSAPSRLFVALQNPKAPNTPLPSPFPLRHLIESSKPSNNDSTILLNPILVPFKDENSTTHLQSSLIFPSYPFGFFLNPSSSTGLVQSAESDVVSGESPVIWADSVKKKRKRKMNKHKYRKLRKRLRRQT